MSELFMPLDGLLRGGGDPRLNINPATGASEYGCRPFPCPEMPSFASSTATSISQRAYDRAAEAREALMRSALAIGLDAAFENRIEAMRDELKVHLGLSRTNADVVFSPSGTDSQLHALFLARALLGPALTTVVVAADQTGSGTADTARGHHFNVATANGNRVPKGDPIDGPAASTGSIAIRLCRGAGDFRSADETDAMVFAAVENAVGSGTSVLLQVMDSSKLGWRAPSDQCLDEIVRRWPRQVQVVVDACQMRLGRPRLRNYLERGYMVIVTGSKFFTGPAFSGALLLPSRFSNALDAVSEASPGFCEYTGRNDWPLHWRGLRSRLPVRANFGQWLRWEAALEEIGAYYRVPDEFRRRALAAFGNGVERIIASSPSLRLLPPQQRLAARGAEDEELAEATIFAVVIGRDPRILGPDDCRAIYRALASADADPSDEAGRRPEIPKPCLVGQPVALGGPEQPALAALRICASARLVTEAWSTDEGVARRNIEREIDGVSAIAARIERLYDRPARP